MAAEDRSGANGKLDETIEETFPASDAPASTVETGIGVRAVTPEPRPSVTDNAAQHRFELTLDGQTAFLRYERTAGVLKLIHTEVPNVLRGQHLGVALVEFALRDARASGLRVLAICPFVKAYLRKHPSGKPETR